MKAFLRKTRGITLIALVITIIVLLILAGVALSLVLGEDGITSRAVKAGKTQNMAGAKDKVELDAANYGAEFYQAKYVNGNLPEDVDTVQKYIMYKFDARFPNRQPGAYDDSYTLTVNKNQNQVTLTSNIASDTTTAATAEIDTNGKVVWQATAYGEASGNNSGNAEEQQGGTELANLPNDSIYKLAQAGVLQRGDKIMYNPGNGTTAMIDLPSGTKIKETKLASLDLPDGVTLNGTINANSAEDWIIFNVNQTTGEVLIIPRKISNTTLILEGKDGYNNSIEALNMVASIYVNDSYAQSARSINAEEFFGKESDAELDDIEFYNSYSIDENTLKIVGESTDSSLWKTWHSGNVYAEDDAFVNFFERYGFEMSDEGDGYDPKGENGAFNCWIGSRVVKAYLFSNKKYCNCGLYQASGGRRFPNLAFIFFLVESGAYANPNVYDCPGTVLPVVTLKPDVQIECSTTYTETATGTELVEGPTDYPHYAWSFK